MITRHLVAIAALSAMSFAQEVHREVVPGREFRDSKVLTPGQVDLWHLDVEANEVLRCDVSAQDLDPVIDLVDADGNVLLSDDGEGSKSYLQYRAKAAGKLVVRVRGFQGAGGGRYELVLERYVAPALEVGERTDGTFGVEQWAHVRLQLERGDVVVPVVDGARLTSFWLFAERRRIEARLGAYVVPEAGEYHLRLEGPNRQRFQLRTRRARRLDAGSAEDRPSLLPATGLDIVRVHLPAKRAVMFDLQMPGFELQRWYELLGERPRWFELVDARKGGSVRRVFWSERALDVDLWLRNPTGQDVDYSFVARAVDRDLPPAGVPARLPLGDLGVHTIAANVGDIVHVHVHTQMFDPGLVIAGPDGQRIGAIDDRGPLDRSASITFHAQQTGTYRAIVYCHAHAGCGDYQIDVSKADVPVVAFDENLPLRVGPKDEGHARLQIAAGQEVWLSVRSGEVDVALTVVDDRGRRLGCWEGGGVGGNVLAALRSDYATALTLFVHSRKGRGTCHVRALAVE